MGHILRVIEVSLATEYPFGVTAINQSVGLTEVDYVSTPNDSIRLEDYVPVTPNLRVVDYDAQGTMDGGERISTTRANVTETCKIRVLGSSMAAVRNKIGAIESIIRQAEQYNRYRIGNPCYVEAGYYDPTDTTRVRSEILSGTVQPGKTMLNGDWAVYQVPVTITWTRRFYWEDEEFSSVSMIGPFATSSTEVSIINAPDSNWIRLSPGVVSGKSPGRGVLPSPAMIRMQFQDGSINESDSIYNIWCGSHWRGVTTINTYLVAPTGYTVVSPGTASVVADGTTGYTTFSGSCLRLGNASGQVYWPLTDPWQQTAQGVYNLLMRQLSFRADLIGTRWRPKIWYKQGASIALTEIWAGEWIYFDQLQELQDLGAITIPPEIRVTLQTSLVVGFEWADKPVAGNIDLDYLDFLPKNSFAHWIYNAVGQRHLFYMYDIGYLYSMADGFNFYQVVRRIDGPVMLWPGIENRLVFQYSMLGGSLRLADSMKVAVRYRARYLTISQIPV